MPIDKAEIAPAELVYNLLGLHGYRGSMDGVHLAWDNCPAQNLSNYKGKEGYPTVAYNVTCDHSKRVLSVHGAFPGSRNDKSIAVTDPAIAMAKEMPAYTEFEYTLYDNSGKPYQIQGWFVLHVVCIACDCLKYTIHRFMDPLRRWLPPLASDHMWLQVWDTSCSY